jgi:hypothetical protein
MRIRSRKKSEFRSHERKHLFDHCCHLKTQATANAINVRLILKAAQAVMPVKEYTSFRAQMERAYQTKDKA